MIVVDCVQGGARWWAAKLGVPSASEFDKIVTPAKLDYSRQSITYRNKLLGEWLRGKPDDHFVSQWMKRGHEFEPEAREAYAFIRGVSVEQVGFCYAERDTLHGPEFIGVSPDGLIGDEGTLELKCPSPGVHTGYLLDNKIPTEYRAQLLGALLVTGRRWSDFVSYHPDLPTFIQRLTAADVVENLDTMDKALTRFCTGLAGARATLLEKGYEPAPVDLSADFPDTAGDGPQTPEIGAQDE